MSLGCKTNDHDGAKTKANTHELTSSNEIDFQKIRDWVEGKRIVSIGESTHGFGEFYAMKSEIVQFLHKDMGYEILAMEAGFGEINLAWLNISNLDDLTLRDKTLFGNFRCSEIEPLFKYIKENSVLDNPLIYTGFDPQISGDYYTNYLDSICLQLKLEIDIDEAFNAYYTMYQATSEPDSTNFIKYRDSYQSTLVNLKKAIIDNKKTLSEAMNLGELELQIILRNLEMQHKAVDYSYANRMNPEYTPQGTIIRDQLMADNISWIMENLYPDKKIIIWAHNAHIQIGGINGHETKLMGQHLKDAYGDNYFSIGLFAYKGKVYQHWTGNSIAFENSDSTSIEYKMKNDNLKYSFQKFGNTDVKDWTNKEVSAFEIENGGKVNFVPSDRFDAVISVYSGGMPTFGK